MSEGGGAVNSPWPKRLLIAGLITLILGVAGLAFTLPSISEQLLPDTFNEAVIEPGESIEVNLTGLKVYSLFQNTTESKEIDGSVTILDNGVEVELREASIFAGVGDMDYRDGTVFSTMGWVQPSESTTMQFISDSNQTIYIVDQNRVSEEAFTQPVVLSSCFALLASTCLLPLSLIFYFLRKKDAPNSSNVTLKTSDGREINLAMEGLSSSGAVLTTEQIYALARLQEKAGPGGKITVDIQMPRGLGEQSTPPPFADRPDTQQTAADFPSKSTDNLASTPTDNQTSPASKSKSSTETSKSPTIEKKPSSKSKADQENQPNWKDWDEG